MFRKDLIPLLKDNPMSVVQIAREVDESPKTIEEDLQHLFRSLKHGEFEPRVEPARCRKCGFEFGFDKLRKPSKCPECNSTWLTEPKISVQAKV
jgi:predicted Zn-ribbon and HTH transcriptional regulator